MAESIPGQVREIWTRQRKHVANFLSFVVLRVLALGAFAVSVPIFINRASEAAYGVVAIGFSLLGIATIFDVGIGFVVVQLVARRVARRGSANPRAFNHLLWLYVSGATLASVLLLVAVLLVPLSAHERFFYGCLGFLLPFLAVSGTAAAVYQGHGELVYLNASRFLFEIGKGVAVALSGLWFADYPAVGPLLLACAFLRACADIRFLRVRLGYRLLPPDGIVSRGALRLAMHGAFSMAAAVLMVAVNILDKALIATWFSKEEVAHYSIAFDLNTKAYLLVHALNSTMLTVLLHNYARRMESARHVRFALVVVLAVAVGYYLPLAVWARDLVELWVNPEVAYQVAPLVRIMAVASVLYLFGSVFETGLLARAAPRFVFFVTLAAVASYALGVAWLPPRLGVIGFVWAYVMLCTAYLIGMVIGHSRPSLARAL